MIIVDRISAHDSHGKAVLAAPREDTKHTEAKSITELFVNITDS